MTQEKPNPEEIRDNITLLMPPIKEYSCPLGHDLIHGMDYWLRHAPTEWHNVRFYFCSKCSMTYDIKKVKKNKLVEE